MLKDKAKKYQNNSYLKNYNKLCSRTGIHRSNSLLSVSSLSLSQTSTEDDSSLTADFYSCSFQPKRGRVGTNYPEIMVPPPLLLGTMDNLQQPCPMGLNHRVVNRCHWITNTTDKTYVSFHDEQWGVPVYDDNQLFELLSMSGMLMDYNWAEIIKRRCQLRNAFGGFDINFVAQMGEEEISNISCSKELALAECRTRCIVENAKRTIKLMKEHGSFSSYLWGNFNFKPIINKYRYPRNIPLRTPKADVISKDLVRRGFRLVGPVIIQSFTQAAGFSIDHLVDCFRYNECVSLAENPWRHM